MSSRLNRELRELVPRPRAPRIARDRRFEVARCIRRAQRADLGLRGMEEAVRDRGGMLRGVGMVGERAEVERGLAPELALEAALAERERDRQRAAIEPVRLVEQLVRFVAIADEVAAALDDLRELLGRRLIRRGREALAQDLGGLVVAMLRREQLGERERGFRAVRARAEDRAQPAFARRRLTSRGLRERLFDDERAARGLELLGELLLEIEIVDVLLDELLERGDRGLVIAGLGRAARGFERHHDPAVAIRLRRRVAEQGLGMRAAIAGARRVRREALEAGQVVGGRRQQVAQYARRARAIAELVVEDRDQPQAQCGDVLGRRAAIDRFVDARRDDLRRLARLTAAREHVRVIDEAAHVIGRVARGLGDERRGRCTFTRLLERARLTAQQHGLLDAGRACRDLTAHLRDLGPPVELRQRLVERLPGVEVARPAIDDLAIRRRGVIELAVVAIQLARRTQRRARAIVTRQRGDALERLGRLLPRAGAAIQPREPIVMLDVVGLELDDRFHRGDRLERLIEVLVDIRELLEERGLDLGPARRGARFILEQQRELLPRALLGGERAQVTARLGLARLRANLGDRHAERLDRIDRDLARQLLPLARAMSLVLRHYDGAELISAGCGRERRGPLSTDHPDRVRLRAVSSRALARKQVSYL